MTRYVAFLRGINVGGHQIVKMEDLRQRFVGLGFDDVTTYKASGNVRFETSALDPKRVRRRVQTGLRSMFGEEVEVLLRSVAEIDEIVRLDPFRSPPRSPAVPYVTFLSDPPRAVPRLPTRSPKADVEVFLVHGRDVFSWALPIRDHYGFPNLFVEKLFGRLATTRNWSTVGGVAPLSR